MALSGIEIYKKLPRTNCKECGVPTCMAFAMKLATGQAELSQCPYVSEETKAELDEASAPPIRPVTIGAGDKALKIGGETVMFRHEKTFFNPTGIAILISDDMEDAEIDGRLKSFKELEYDRVGLLLRADLVACKCASGDPSKFEGLVKKVSSEVDAGIILMSENVDALESALKAVAEKKPLIYAATRDNADKLAGLAKEHSCPLAAKGDNLDDTAELTEKLMGLGIKDIVIDSGSRELGKGFQDQIVIRRAALQSKFKPLGFPTITLPCEMTDDPMMEALMAATFIAKYGGIVVLSDIKGESLFPLLLERMNIYTDPQRPMVTSPGIYEINNPDENSPVLITTNFSLTYFIVSAEVEGSKIPSWLLVFDTEGLSVMTGWAAGKFVGDAVGPWVKKCGITDKVKDLRLVIPGVAAAISGELEEELPDWKILIGPREAAHITPFLKEL